MIRSMTGFGEAELETDAGVLRVEIKTVNHRFFNATIRTPHGFDRFEHLIEGWLKERISRGHVKYTLTLDSRAAVRGRPALEVDLERARLYLEMLEEMREELALPGQVNLEMLARFADIFRKVDDAESGPGVSEEELRRVTDRAAESVVEMRDQEGARLRDDFQERLRALDEQLAVVKHRAPERLAAERERLRVAVQELTDGEDVDEDRLAREIAYLAEKWDVNEEIVRLASHVELFGEILESPASEPVGKRMGFAVQEMHREVNTIGAKANDADLVAAAMAMKEEVERLREQLENVE